MIGILITSHPGHCEIGLRECLESIAGIGYATVFGFDDDSFDCDIPIPTGVKLMLTGRAQEDLPFDWKMHQGEHIQITEGLKILKRWGLKYVFKLCGDMYLKTTNLWDLPLHMETMWVLEHPVKSNSCGYKRLNSNIITWEHPEGWLGTKAFFGEIDLLIEITRDIKKINFLIESTYTKVAAGKGISYKSMNKAFWLDYVGGRI